MKTNILNKYSEYLKNVKNLSENTLEAYIRDCAHFCSFLQDNGRTLLNAGKNEAREFVIELNSSGRSSSTVSRCVSSLKSLYAYLENTRQVKENPFASLKIPHTEKKRPIYLTPDETDAFLSSAQGESVKEIRDKAMLEVMYASGIKTSELISLHIRDIDTDLGYIRLCRTSNIRIVPLGKTSVEAVKKYMEKSRPKLTSGDIPHLFVNCSGGPISRQGFWKIVKEYAKKAGIEKEISPESLRNSFALHLISNGADTVSVAEMLGYKDLSGIQKFASLSKRGIREIYNKAHPRA